MTRNTEGILCRNPLGTRTRNPLLNPHLPQGQGLRIAENLGIPDSTLSGHLTVTKPQDYSPRANLSTIKDLIVPLSVQ